MKNTRVPIAAAELAEDHLIDFCICQLSPAGSSELWRMPDHRCIVHRDQDECRGCFHSENNLKAMALGQVAA